MLVPRGRISSCFQCGSVSEFSSGISDIELPVIVQCPKCHDIKTYRDEKDIAKLPKANPAKLEGKFIITLISEYELEDDEPSPVQESKHEAEFNIGEADDETSDTLRSKLDDVAGSARLPSPSIHGRSVAIADNVSECIALAESIRADLLRFSAMFYDQMREVWDTHEFITDFSPGYMSHFVNHPFGSFPVQTGNELVSIRTNVVLTPFFFRRVFGFPLAAHGGYIMQLVNPFSMIYKPLAPWEYQRLSIRPPVELEVAGRKIIGMSVRRIWRSIPGVSEDHGHTNSDPSIRITNSMIARSWLAKHGVTAWEPVQIDSRDFDGKLVEYIRENSNLYKHAHDELAKNSRVLFAWRNFRNLIKFCWLNCIAYKGPTLIICHEYQEQDWSRDSQKGIADNAVCTTWDKINIAGELDYYRMIVLDYRDGIPEEYANRFFRYSGSLVVAANDPVMDSLESSLMAERAYGLVASCNVDTFRPRLDKNGIQFFPDTTEKFRVILSSLIRGD